MPAQKRNVPDRSCHLADLRRAARSRHAGARHPSGDLAEQEACAQEDESKDPGVDGHGRSSGESVPNRMRTVRQPTPRVSTAVASVERWSRVSVTSRAVRVLRSGGGESSCSRWAREEVVGVGQRGVEAVVGPVGDVVGEVVAHTRSPD